MVTETLRSITSKMAVSMEANAPALGDDSFNEAHKTQEKVVINISNGKSVHPPKSNSALSFVRAEFGTTVVGESAKCEVDNATGLTEYNFECSLDINVSDPVMLDNFVQTPIVITVIEVLPKDKKAKEEKTNVIGQACADLLPLLQGQKNVSLNAPLHPTGTVFDASLPLEQNLPELKLSFSVNEPLFAAEQLKTSNLMRICIESMYSLPESWSSTGNQYMYLAVMPFPISSTKEVSVLVPNGCFRMAGEKEQSNKRKWCLAPTASGPSLYMQESTVSKATYKEEDGDLCREENGAFRQEAENEKPRVTWNVERRCFLTKSSSESFMKKIAQHRIWPVEVFRMIVTQGSKVKGKGGDEDNQLSFHGVAYIDMATLLYPGVKRIRGAFRLKPFNDTDLLAKTGRKNTVIEEASKLISLLKSNSSTMVAKAPQSKAAKLDGKPKPSAAILKPPEGFPDSENSEMRKNEGQQYAEACSYVLIDFELDAPLVAKREPAVLAKKVLDIIPARPAFAKKEGGAKKAIEAFQNQIGLTSNQLLEEFRKMFASELKDVDKKGGSERKSEFLYHLNSSGKYFALKEQLRYFVSKIVREKFMNTSQFTDKIAFQAFIAELYEFLLSQMHIGLNRFLSTEETTEVPPPVRDSDMIKFFAKEAEILFDYSLAAKCYQERIALNKSDPDHWLDYGCFCLYIGDTQKAVECFKEVVSFNQKHFAGLIMNGCTAEMQENFESAEVFFEMAAYTFHESDVAWTMLGLHYAGCQNDIMAERAFNEAERLSNPSLLSTKSYIDIKSELQSNREDDSTGPSDAVEAAEEKEEDGGAVEQKPLITEAPDKPISTFLKTASFLLDHKALILAERALSHELIAAGHGESAAYFQLLAELQKLKKEYDNAKQNIEECLKLQHENPDAWSLLGHLYFLTAKQEDAKNAYERALAYSTDAKDIHSLHLRLASIYIKERQYQKAKDLYLNVCEKKATCMTWLGVGISSFRLGNLVEAEHALNEANILDNHNSDVWGYLTLVSLQQKRHLEAEQCHKFALKTGLDNGELLDEIAKSMKDNDFDTSLVM